MKAVVLVKLGYDYLCFPMWMDESIPFIKVLEGAKYIPSADVSWKIEEVLKDAISPPAPQPPPEGDGDGPTS